MMTVKELNEKLADYDDRVQVAIEGEDWLYHLTVVDYEDGPDFTGVVLRGGKRTHDA